MQGDRLMIRRAISNLLSNAVKYAEPASTIDISIGSSDGRASLAITNHGEEIPVVSQASLFDRFVRLSSPKVKDAGGLGLGLAITKAIMRAHHGQVKLRSLAGANTFVLEFQMVRPPVALEGPASVVAVTFVQKVFHPRHLIARDGN